ncbi:MAG: SwmB domain-containing protein, partial [Alphaproteobacteria bacterium]|nr:SwmB domain-containing protein [Alphaproteobacteria bacterium]
MSREGGVDPGAWRRWKSWTMRRRSFLARRGHEDGPAARQPDLQTDRQGTGPVFGTAACALAAVFALLLAAGAAQAQTSVTLVSNTGQSSDATSVHNSHRAQSFTTGNNAAGYKLTSVTFPIGGSIDSSKTQVRIESYGSDNKPGGSLGTLTLSQSGTTVTGTTTGIDLAASTTYFVVLQSSDSTLANTFQRTNSDNEDADAAEGWSIGNGSLWHGGTGNPTWGNTSNSSWQIAIHGYAKTAPPTVSGVEVVSTPSLDVDDDSTPETYGQGGKICIQATFSEAVTVTGTPRLKIDMDLDESWGEKFANYESGSGTAKLTFAYEVVAGNGSTKGIAVVENSLALNGGGIVAASDGTTAANLAHSGLGHQANHEVHGDLGTTNPSSCASPSSPSAPDTTAPRLTRATVDGDTLRLGFNESLDPASIPAAAEFAVTVDGSTAAPSAVGLSGSVVTLTLAGAVEPGAAVTVSYTPGGNPLRDAAGNEVAAFTDRPVGHGAPEAQQRAFAGALASVASRTVAGAQDMIGARLGDAVPASELALAGRPMSFGGSDAGGPDSAIRFGEARSRGMDAGEFLGSSAFSLALGAAENGKGPKALRWGVWGRGDYGSFEGRAGAGARYEGETRTGWLGADAR